MEIKSFEDVADFCTYIQSYRRPAILKNFPVGSCLERWKDPCYLQEKLEDKVAKIHKVEKELADQMDFRTKNFQYQSLPLGLITKVNKSNLSTPVKMKTRLYLPLNATLMKMSR